MQNKEDKKAERSVRRNSTAAAPGAGASRPFMKLAALQIELEQAYLQCQRFLDITAKPSLQLLQDLQVFQSLVSGEPRGHLSTRIQLGKG